ARSSPAAAASGAGPKVWSERAGRSRRIRLSSTSATAPDATRSRWLRHDRVRCMLVKTLDMLGAREVSWSPTFSAVVALMYGGCTAACRIDHGSARHGTGRARARHDPRRY